MCVMVGVLAELGVIQERGRITMAAMANAKILSCFHIMTCPFTFLRLNLNIGISLKKPTEALVAYGKVSKKKDFYLLGCPPFLPP